MARTIQYNLNDDFRNCFKYLYEKFEKRAKNKNINIKNTKFTYEELRELIDEYYSMVKDIEKESKKGILKQLSTLLEVKKINKNGESVSYYYLKPITNLFRLSNKKIDNEILYIGLLYYSEGFSNAIKIIYNLLGPTRKLTTNKIRFIGKIKEVITRIENSKKKPLSATSINNIAERTISNLIYVGLIIDNKLDRSLEENQIRIKNYYPDFRILLILYLNELEEKNQNAPPLNNIINEYNFVKFFFLNKQKLKRSLEPGFEKNLFFYQQQIGYALKVNYDQWEISFK